MLRNAILRQYCCIGLIACCYKKLEIFDHKYLYLKLTAYSIPFAHKFLVFVCCNHLLLLANKISNYRNLISKEYKMTEIFISYTKQDKIAENTAREIHQKLLDKRKDYKPYFDERSTNINNNIDNEIKEKIEACDLFIFLISKNTFKSYATNELVLIRDKWNSPLNLVLPALIDSIQKKDIPNEYRVYLDSARFHETKAKGNRALSIVERMEKMLSAPNSDTADDSGSRVESDIKVENLPIPTDGGKEPYLALRPFGPNNGNHFFGREGFIKKLVDKIDGGKDFIAIVGASGAGKSSVVLAGLVPALHKSRNDTQWSFTYFNLERSIEKNNEFYPYSELALALHPFCDSDFRDSKELARKFKESKVQIGAVIDSILNRSEPKQCYLIIADQFEPLFFEKNNLNEAYHFFKALLDGIKKANEKNRDKKKKIVLVITVRDFNAILSSGEMSNEFDDHLLILGSIKKEDIDNIILGKNVNKDDPKYFIAHINEATVKIERKVVEEIKKAFGNEIEDEINLPLLQYTLWNLWNQNKNKNEKEATIVSDDYIEKGVLDALNDAGIDTLNDLKSEGYDENTIANFFLEFVDVNIDESNKNVHLRARNKSDFSTEQGNRYWKIAKHLATNNGNRLIELFQKDKNGPEFAKIAHTALIFHWIALKKWIDDKRDNLHLRKRLESKFDEWKNEQIPERLLRGELLETAINNVKEKKITDKALVDYVNESLNHKNNQRRIGILKVIALLLGLFLLLVLSLSAQYLGKLGQIDEDTRERISFGEKFLIPSDFIKRDAIREFKLTRYKEAEEKFEQYFKRVDKRKDPEAWIYSNNAAILENIKDISKHNIVVASVPIEKNDTVANEILRGIAYAQGKANVKCSENCTLIAITSDDNDPKIAKRIADYLIRVELTLDQPKESEDSFIKNLSQLWRNILQQFFPEGNVLAVIGHNASKVSNAVADVYQGKMVMISPTSYTFEHQDTDNNYLFKTIFPVEETLKGLSKYIIASYKNSKTEVHYCADGPAHDNERFTKEFRTNFEKTTVEFTSHKNGKMICNFHELGKLDPEIEGSKNIFLSTHVNTIIDAIVLAGEILAVNDNRVGLYAVNTPYTKDVLEEGGKVLRGLVIAVNWHSQSHNDEGSVIGKKNKEFVDFFLSKNKDDYIDITWRTAFAYDAAKVVINALKNSEGKTRITREKLRENISNTDIPDGLTGKISFETNGERKLDQSTSTIHLVKLCEYNGYKFIPLVKDEDSLEYKLKWPDDSNEDRNCYNLDNKD